MFLQVKDLSFSYPDTPVLEGLTFSLAGGEFLGILGANGSGKSTLLRLLDRILVPQSGWIRLKGRDLNAYSRRDLARIVAYVPQDFPWAFPFTVREVVLMGRSPHLGGRMFEHRADLDAATRAMEKVDILALADQPITAISGGERQRALIARALAQEPEILLLDEPNAHLDVAHQLAAFRVLREHNRQQGLTVICVSHDLTLTAAFSTTVLLLGRMRPGPTAEGSMPYRMQGWGPPETVLTADHLASAFSTRVLVDRHPTAGTPRITCDTTFSPPRMESP